MDQKLENIVKCGLEFLNKGGYEKAEKYFDEAIEIENNNSQAYFYRAQCYMKKEEYQKALTDLDRCIELEPNNWKAQFYRNKNIYIFNENNCKSILSQDFNVKNLSIRAEDFETYDSIGLAECGVDTIIWDNYISVLLKISLRENDIFDNDKIEGYIEEFKRALFWFENNKNKVFDALVKYGMTKLAEEWVEGSEQVEVDGENFFADGEILFKLPISEKDFYKSLYLNGMDIEIDEGMEVMNSRILIEAFIDTKPDYFGGHSMQVMVIDGNEIVVRGITG